MEFKKVVEEMEEEVSEPVSPLGQYFNSSALSLVILGVLEVEVPIDDSQALPLLKDVFLPINPRFSSIMMVDEHGEKQWKKVEVNLKDHVNVPIFPPEKSPQFYDKCLRDYISKIGMEPFPQNQPLWDIHIIKYPTNSVAGTVIFKLHHSLGDGFSLMGALLSCLQRADDSSQPLTFPSVRIRSGSVGGSNGIFRVLPRLFSSIFNSVSDFYWSVIKSNFVEDDQSPIRSGNSGLGFARLTVSTSTFPLHQIKQIKASLGVTVNDVIAGVIFLGIRLYMKSISPDSSNSHSTAIVPLNTRMLRSYSSVKEMVKPDAKSPWGNHFALLQIPIPKLTEAQLSDPLEFVKNAHQVIKTKRSSFGVYLTAKLLEIINKFRGPEEAAKYVYRTLHNCSLAMTNMIGPLEQMSLADHPIKSLYFMLFGLPQSLVVTIVSYMGQLRVSVGTEDGFIDSQKLKSCIENAYEMILKAC